MEVPLVVRSLWGHFGKAEKTFLLVLVAYFISDRITGGSVAAMLLFLALVVTGFWVSLKWLRWGIRKSLWRLRDRLVVAYLFIALVPILLVGTLIALSSWGLAGQLAVFLVNSEFQRSVEALDRSAQVMARVSADQYEIAWQNMQDSLAGQFPEVRVLVRDRTEVLFARPPEMEPPPEVWGEIRGLVYRDGRLYVWARAIVEGIDVTALAPLTPQVLDKVAAGVGAVLVRFDPAFGGNDAGGENDVAEVHGAAIPSPRNGFDIQLPWGNSLEIARWDAPQEMGTALLAVQSRLSAVWSVISSQRVEAGVLILTLYVLAGAFLVVEIISLIIGVSITRTVTTAVDDLYQATVKLRGGDLSHRIEVHGNDQVATVSDSFNRMAENLESLLAVAKEKERLETELEIAREVQHQLYPKEVPPLEGLELVGQCHPARVVSGDYYDYQPLGEGNAIIALGDVAGKGISAALLMATLQSSLRTQVSASLEKGSSMRLSTSRLVSQLNHLLFQDTAPEKYATFLFGIYDDEAGTLTYTNAGHLPPVLVRKGQASQLDVNGTVVGAFPFSRYDESRLQLESGDLLVAYTDGITEPENEYGEMFGESRLYDVLVRSAELDTGAIIDTVMSAVEEWTGSPELQDDMTLLVVRKR